MLTGKQPKISKMQKFRLACYAYRHDRGLKLDSRCERGVFVGYKKNSPAYMIYYPNTKKIQKHRLVEFVPRKSAEADMLLIDDDDFVVTYNARESGKAPEVILQSTQKQATVKEPVACHDQGYLDDYVCGFEADVTDIDYCYRHVCSVSQTYKKAVTSMNPTHLPH